MNVAFCYESVLPARGGCETYIADLARRLLADRHEVHLYACRWDEAALPSGIHYHGLPTLRGPRFLRPWRFGRYCERALRGAGHEVSIGFDKTWGQDVLYPQGGLHAASAEHNLRKYANPGMRAVARLIKACDLAHWSFSRLERRQYLGADRPLVIVNSLMVRNHFQHYYGISPENLHVVRSAIDPHRFPEQDRLKRRLEWRQRWGLETNETIALFAAMNYRLKGLEPLLYALARLVELPECRSAVHPFRLVVAGNPNFKAYQRLAEKLGVAGRILFVGHCGDMRDAYFASDFLVHPTFYDPCSLVVLEALACGLPVITTRANGASELLHPLQEGYVIDDPHDHDRLAWAMGQLLDPARRSAYGLAARKTAGQWSFEHHYREMLHVFIKAAARRHAA